MLTISRGVPVKIDSDAFYSRYSDLLDCLHISEKDVALFRDDNPGFCGVDCTRVSRLLVAQLTSARKHRTFNSYSVTDVIQKLEGVGRNGCEKREKPFKHPPLQGFWKAHFFDARFLIKNLKNHWGLGFEDSPKFNALCSRVAEEEEKTPSAHGWQGRLAHEFTICGYEERAKRKNLTGEWIVFSKHNSRNYYLCLTKHSTSIKEDGEIYALLKNFCTQEYPFLFADVS